MSDSLADAIKVAYQLCCPPISGWSVPASRAKQGHPLLDLNNMIENLQKSNEGDRTFSALDKFVTLLSLPDLNPNPSLRERLGTWAKQRNGDQWPLLQQEVQPLLDKYLGSQQPTAPKIESHLLIHVKDESTDTRSVSALYIRDASQYDLRSGMGSEPVQSPGCSPFQETVSLDTLPSLVQACLDEVLDQNPNNLTLHLILPLTWLHTDCDRWLVKDISQMPFLPKVPLGIRFRCVLRITERLNPQILNLYRESWETKWQTLHALSPEQMSDAFVLGDNLSLESQLFAKLNQPQSLGLKLSTVYEDAQQYYQVFGTLIATGTPAAVWLRDNQFSQELDVTAKLDQFLNCKMSQLPAAVQGVRSDSSGTATTDHIGHHLSFLWEDPHLIPPSTQQSLGMSQP